MLTGKELGDAINQAIKLKIASGAVSSKKEIAQHFGIEPPSIHDWIKKGSISKDKLPELWDYFSDVVGKEHWGISKTPIIFSEKDNDSDELLHYDKNDKDLIEILNQVIKLSGKSLGQRAQFKRVVKFGIELSKSDKEDDGEQ